MVARFRLLSLRTLNWVQLRFRIANFPSMYATYSYKMTKKLATKLRRSKLRSRLWWSSMARWRIFLSMERERPPSWDSNISMKLKTPTNTTENSSQKVENADQYTKTIPMPKLFTLYLRFPKTSHMILARMKVWRSSRFRSTSTSKTPKSNNFLRNSVKPTKVSKETRPN